MRNSTKLSVFLCFLASTATAQIYNGPVKLGSPLVSYKAITQEFGVDWSRNPELVHTGVDLALAAGNKVFSMKDGVVYKVGNLGGSDGDYVVVFNRDGTSNGYLHLNVSVKSGQRVDRGQIIGTVYSNHLHLNQCKQSDGCQHGAFPNKTFKGQSRDKFNEYYVRPRIR
ncbi:M23 family peptidase [Sphingorhabdus pulchriflava]|uniref:M23 family peptidase n=1 Tax=Sphingorhabdus pulchriflava TaxID=2292257 RepID=A0A371BEG3_9SPHN|nr:M23 family metallopeptidase [Sphingorhabdus pulchriflava]RDV05960.1 M23 family peptidase [Sphingorhabdus pulchriflava]